MGVHCQGEPAARFAVEAGVASIDHATQLSDGTMEMMKKKDIPAVPTFVVFEYFADHAPNAAAAAREHAMLDYKIHEFKRQVAAGVPMAVGSDVGPFPHGTQARELALMVKYGMTPLAALQADYLNDPRILTWQDEVGQLKPGYFADVIAVPGNPLEDITAVEHVPFVMKGGVVYKDEASGQQGLTPGAGVSRGCHPPSPVVPPFLWGFGGAAPTCGGTPRPGARMSDVDRRVHAGGAGRGPRPRAGARTDARAVGAEHGRGVRRQDPPKRSTSPGARSSPSFTPNSFVKLSGS